MSRWDALNLSINDEPRRRNHRAAPVLETMRKAQNTAAARRWEDEKSATAFEALFLECQRQLETAKVTSLANLVISSASALSSKALKAIKVVDEVFLPYLEKKLQEQQRLSPSHEDNERGISAVVHALCSFLNSSSQHVTSSIMAPLVSEIQSDGSEIQISNPIRIRLFCDLQSLLLLLIKPSDDNTCGSSTRIILERVAMALVAALKLAKRIDGTAKHAESKNYDLDPTAAYNFYAYCRSTSLHSASDDDAYFSLSRIAVELIKTLMKRHPESSCTLATLILIGDRTWSSNQYTVQSCRTCAYGNNSNAATTTMFLDMLHEPAGRIPCGDLGRAVDIVKAVLENYPLSLWLQHQQRDGKTPQHRGGRRDGQCGVKTTAWGFRERLSQGLENLIEITKCRMISFGMSNSDNQTILLGCALAGCIFRVVPFHGGSSEAVRLQKSGRALVQASVDLCTTHSMPQVRQAATEALLEGMGGRLNPQGELKNMSFPIRVWLCCPEGNVFVTETTEAILRNVGTRDHQNNSAKAQLVRAMLRTYPGLFFKTNYCWESLARYMRTCSESRMTQARLEGALALQSLMNGRKDFGCGTDNMDTDFDSSRPIKEFVVPVLLTMLNRGSDGASFRCAILAAYGLMLPNDWQELATSRPRMDHVHINLILDIAQESQTSDKVRSEAFKAIGDICTSYFSAPDERVMGMLGDDLHCKNICENVCQVLLSMLDSSHCRVASVRASVVLAMGNLVHALRDPSIPIQCPSTISLLPACILAELANDKDGKLSGNAIRTLGHVTCLFFREDYSISLASLGFDRKWLLRSAIQALTSRVQSAVMLARGELRSLSWKQRSIIKKHAWGSCNSLASIFGAGIVSSVHYDDAENSEDENIRECVSCLLRCVEESHLLHEKVTISAMVALCSTDSSTLFCHCGKDQLSMTDAIVVCIMLVYKRHPQGCNNMADDDVTQKLSLSAKVAEQAALLLERLLRCCSIPDAAKVLRSQSISITIVDFLYQWMLEKDCPTTIFDTFALAMQRPNVQIDVQTEQRFASRAMSLLCQYNQDDEL